ncbi:MAG: hypothetical protein ACRDPC_26830 [Solirubrobacteraceae bacterium]
MGRRSRKRHGDVIEALPVPARPDPTERPKAPWHPFPLVELCALLGIVLLVLGLFDLDSERGRLLLVTGMVLGSLAGLDTSLREHFSGFRSHSTVLAGIPAVITAAAVYFAQLPWPVVILGAIAAFAISFTLLARAYRRRAR